MSKTSSIKTPTKAERAEKLSASTKKIFEKRDGLYKRLAQGPNRDSSRKG